MVTKDEMKNGLAASALLAGGIGALILGMVTTLAEAIPAFRAALIWVAPVGPLSGKTSLAVIFWLLSWGILGRMWKDKDVNFDRIVTISFALLMVGLLGTFPPFFELFAPE